MGIIQLINKVKFVKTFFQRQYFKEHILTTQYKNVELKGNNHIVNTTIDEYSYISLNSIIYHSRLGKFCSIGPNVIIGYGDHPTNYLSTSPRLFFKEIFKSKALNPETSVFKSHKLVNIGSDVWIGANCYIKNGITIGHGAIVGAGSVVLKDIPSYAIVGGVPAKIIKYRFSNEIISKLQNLKWWNYPISTIEMIEPYLSVEITEDILQKICLILSKSNKV